MHSLEYPSDLSWVTFNIREEAKFSDGTPLRAEDVVFTYNLFLEQGLPSYRAVLGSIVETAEIIDPLTVKYSFKPDSGDRDRIGTVGGLPVAKGNV